MNYGIMGNILRVNLRKERISVEQLEETFYRRYFGGRGLIAYFLIKELEPGVDPLAPDNKLIFVCGPVTGAMISGSGRHSVGAKSPLTEGYGEAEAGGFWGVELKRAGFDAIIIEGKAVEPVYLWVHKGEAEIMDASHLWGMEIKKSQETIRNDLKDASVKVAQIGPGGEKMVKYASVINDMNHVAGRCGMGAVMGSKNLKAIAVKGDKNVNVANPESLRQLAQWMARNVDDVAHDLHTYGTGSFMNVYEYTGNLPIHNFRDGKFLGVDSISAQAIKEHVRVGMGTCFACVVACKKEVKVEEPWNVDPAYGGPEYETLAALGSNCGVDDLKAICKANELCQKYSLDTISTGVTISFAMECFEKGLLSKEDTGGVDLSFGNAEAMVKMVEMIGERTGIGDLLAEGVKRAAKRISNGAEKLAIHVKGQEVPMHEPRLNKGLGFGYAISPTGADHIHNIYDPLFARRIPEQYKGLGVLEAVPVGDLGPKKIRLFKYVMIWRSLDNCLVMCVFPPWSVQQKVDIVQSVTGWNTTASELMKISERAINLARIFNIREGFTEEDDWLPPRFFQPKTSGALSSTAVNSEKLGKAKTIYYGMMGWNKQGVPTRTKLEELDIAWAADEMNMK
ncbi:MAG: aldehyde ferredoxin oxidoreductase family protein [Candidatus Bathyarchaeota archaeon]|nr:aldehyde ferredoxin oxidoreductase family protein [Candidatus Bathyarchaeota archaeon]